MEAIKTKKELGQEIMCYIADLDSVATPTREVGADINRIVGSYQYPKYWDKILTYDPKKFLDRLGKMAKEAREFIKNIGYVSFDTTADIFVALYMECLKQDGCQSRYNNEKEEESLYQYRKLLRFISGQDERCMPNCGRCFPRYQSPVFNNCMFYINPFYSYGCCDVEEETEIESDE